MRSLFRIGLATAILALAIIAVIGWREAQSDPVVRAATIVMRGLPASTPPLRVALIADIHVGNVAMPVDRLNRIVGQINARHADAVLIAGDLVNGVNAQSKDFHPEEIAGPLSKLHAPLGVFAVLGNHDNDTSPAQVSAELARAGVIVLHGRVVRLGPIALIGSSATPLVPATLPPLIARARQMGGLRVLMLHEPPFKGLVPQQISVILAGHSHCGQIVFPGFDNAFDYLHWDWRWPPQTRCGLVWFDKHLEIVTGGLGAATVVPLRINAPPDFWMITFVGQR